MLPTITGVARLVADPELRITGNGNAVCQVRMAFNSRRLNKQTNQWEDGDTFWVSGSCWHAQAENVAESLTKGMEVVVSGELRTERWEKDGVKHERPALLIRSIAPSLAYATAQVHKTTRDGSSTPQASQRPQTARQTPQDDPWAVEGPTTTAPPV